MKSAMKFLFLSVVASSLSASPARAADCKDAQPFLATAANASAESERYYTMFKNLMIRIEDESDANFNNEDAIAMAEKAFETAKAFNEIAATALEKADAACYGNLKK